MDWFVFNLVIFSSINDYDLVVIVLDAIGGVKELFQVKIYGKKEKKAKTLRTRNGRKKGWFEIKLLMIGLLKYYDFLWVDRSVC